jgi:hypothetical protein
MDSIWPAAGICIARKTLNFITLAGSCRDDRRPRFRKAKRHRATKTPAAAGNDCHASG